MSKIAVLGYGTVGSGVVEVLKTNRESIANKAETNIDIKYVLDLRDFPGSDIEDILVKDFDVILNDEEVEVIVEVLGGIEPAYTFVKQALLKGKSCATSNKELVAKHGPELLQIAKDNKVNFLFEASVGGGIPIIRPLNQSLTADEITEISGILNGTTNFILTKMKHEGLDFATVLKEAQELGYAELKPEADVEGHDACRKIAILASLAFGRHVDYEDIHTEGITKISQADFEFAKALNMELKLIGRCQKVGDQVFAMVAPMFLEENHPLSHIDGVFNGIYVQGNVIGDVMFYGAGAGKLPTASAVVADVIDAVKHRGKNIITKWSSKQKQLMPVEDIPVKAFARYSQSSNESARDEIEALLGSVTWIDAVDGHDGFVTEMLTEGRLNAALVQLAEKGIHIDNIIRIESRVE